MDAKSYYESNFDANNFMSYFPLSFQTWMPSRLLNQTLMPCHTSRPILDTFLLRTTLQPQTVIFRTLEGNTIYLVNIIIKFF